MKDFKFTNTEWKTITKRKEIVFDFFLRNVLLFYGHLFAVFFIKVRKFPSVSPNL